MIVVRNQTLVILVVALGAAIALLAGMVLAYAWSGQPGWGWMNPGTMQRWGPGGSWGHGCMMGGCGAGMGGGWRHGHEEDRRLTMDEVRERLEGYVNQLGPKYGILEIMEFENNFYAVIYEEDTGIGAMEVLVDPYTGSIMPEPGPNMMWNTRYGMHSAGGSSALMPISPEEAGGIALSYLGEVFDGRVEVEKPIKFYGYYTVDYMVDGVMYGMLSVNGYDGSVWPHTWHGEFIDEIDISEAHD